MPSYDDVMQALRNADAAGNVEDARKLADIASRLRATQDSIPAQPAPAPAPAAPPRREVGFVEAAGRTVGASAIPVVKLYGLAAATAARLFGRKAQDKVFEAMDRVTGSMEREYRPQAGEEFDTAGQFAGGILSLLVEPAGGFGLQHGIERAQEVVQRGGTVGEAYRAGAVTGSVRVALNALPVKVGGAVGRVVENAAGRVIGGGLTGAGLVGVTGVAGRAAENAALPEGEQFSDLRQNVAPSAAELGLGAAFGAVPGALAAARTLRGAAETPVRDLPRKVPEAEKLFPDGVATAIVKPNPVKLAEAAAVERAGGTVNVHNVTERPALREIGRAAQHVPFGGGKTEQNRRAITEATVKLLDPDAKDKQLSTEAFNRINDKNGSTIRENMSSVGDVRIDENVSSQLMDLSKRAVDIIDRDQRAYVMKRIADTLDAAEARGGKLPGSELAKWDSAIGEKIRDHHDNSDLTRPLRELQEIVRDAAEKHMPPGKAKETQVARRRYAYGMTLLPDIKKFGATGYIEPGQLWDLVNRDDLGKRRTMSGGSELTDLAKAAKMIEEPEGHGRLTVGTKLGIGTGAGAVAYLNPAAAGAAATAAVGGSRIYNRVGPALVRRLAKEYDKRQARAAQKPEPPPLELAPEGAPMPQGPRPDVRGEAPAEVPEWTTTAGVDAQKPGSQIPAIEPEGLLPAVGDDMPPARINPEPRGRVPDIPAVPGRPDMPDVMVAGGPREVAATETTGRAMQAPEAALAREQQGYAPKKPEPPAGGGGGGGGTPPADPRLAKIAELRRQAPSQAVKKVLDAREAEIKKVIKRETDIAELEAAAQATDDVDLRQSLLAEANKLRGGKLPVGEVTEGMPDLPKPKTEKIPVGKVIEGQPDLPVGKTEKIPVGEATEITPEVVEPAPERIPVGEATEMPEPLPVGEVVEDPIPVGDAMEFEQMPVGEATEITPELVVPEATNVDNAPTAPAGGGRSKGMEQTKGGYAAEKEAWEKVKTRSATAADALKKYPKGPNGMTPDAVKKTEAWRRDYAEYEQAFANERKWNASMLRKYGAEIRAERQTAREAKVQPQPAPTAPAGGSRSEGMEQPVYFLGSADKHDQVSVYRADGALGKEQVWRGSASDVMRKLEELKRAAKDTAPAPQAPAGGAQPKITHAGMEIEEIPGKGGEPTRWRVTVPETGERVSTPSGLDAAKRMAENERKMIERHGTRPEREKAAEAARAAEEQARADAKKARSAETAGKSLAEIKAMDHMNRAIRVDGKDMKAHEFVDARLAAGDVPKVEMVDRVAPMSRRAVNRASNAEQRAHEDKVKAAGKKESYWLGGYNLSKTEYDYAVKKNTAPQAPQAPAGYTAEKPAQDQAGSTAAGPGASRAVPVSAPEPGKPSPLGLTEEQRRAAIDAETMEDRPDAPEVAQPTKGRRVKVYSRTLNGINDVTAHLYELPGYKGPQLAVKEYKSSRGQGYRVYLPKSGAFIHDNNGVGTLADTLQLAVLRIQNARDTIAKRSATPNAVAKAPQTPQATPEPVKPAAVEPAPRTEAPAPKPAPKPAGKTLTPAEVKAELVRQLDEAHAKAGGDQFTPDDVSGPHRENGNQVLHMRHQPDAESPYNIYLRAVRDDKEGYWTIYGKYGTTGKEVRLDQTAVLSPAGAKGYLARLMPNVAEKDGVPKISPRDSFVMVRAGGGEYKIRNTRERIAEFKKELLAAKPTKPSTRKATDALHKRAPLKTITDMIDDFDSQAAVDFAAAQGIDLEVALKGDRKRLDRVRGLKPTPDTP